MATVYFCSSISGLETAGLKSQEIEMRELTCCTSKILSVLSFISKNNDFIISIGKEYDNLRFFVCERLQGGIFSAFKGKGLSVYQSEDPSFDSLDSCWTDQVAIRNPGKLIEVEKIRDVYDYLVDCDSKGIITIFWHPDRTNRIPEDDQDLVNLAILRYRMYGDSILAKIRQYHPQLMERVISGIESEAFREYGI